MVNDGRKLLIELGAMAEKNSPRTLDDQANPSLRRITPHPSEKGRLQSSGLTKIGQQMAKMPIDPRLGRIILGGAHFGVLNEVLVIVARFQFRTRVNALRTSRLQADQKHALFREADSDFLFYIKLWETLHNNRESMSENKRRTFARNHFPELVASA